MSTDREAAAAATPPPPKAPRVRWSGLVGDRAAIVCLSLLALALYVVAHQPHGVDDAYISFRYAQNFAQGDGPVYNIGERVYGSTAMLWVALLAGVAAAARVPVEHVASLLNALLLCANVVLAYGLLSHLTPSRTLRTLGVALFLLAPRLITVVGLGMETALYTGFTLAALTAATRGRSVIAGMLAGLTFCTRPDGLAVIAAICGGVILEACTARRGTTVSGTPSLRARFLRTALGFALIAIPFAVTMQLYYGSILPNTLGAKRGHPLVSGRFWMLDHFWRGDGHPVGIAVALLCVMGAGLCFVKRFARTAWQERHRAAMLPVLWLAIYVTAWVAVRIDFYPWYIGAMAPASAVVLVAALAPIWQVSRGLLNAALRLAVVMALAWIGVGWARVSRDEVRSWHDYALNMEWLRHRIGDAIAHFTQQEDEVLGTGGIGILGYFAPRVPMVDQAGLVTPMASIVNGTAKRPTLEVHYKRPGEPSPAGTILHMASTPWGGPRAADLLLVSLREQTTFDALRLLPERSASGQLGNARALGVHPLVMRARPGEAIQFAPVWTVNARMSSDTCIRYCLGDNTAANSVRLDTRGFFRDRVPYAEATVGRTYVDAVTLLIPSEMAPGTYPLSATNAATGDTVPETVALGQITITH